jgi:hypothetical protein
MVKSLGDKIKLAFAKHIRGADYLRDDKGEFIRDASGRKQKVEWSGDWQEMSIRIAIGALDPLGVARHESMHQLMSAIVDLTGAKRLIAQRPATEGTMLSAGLELTG